MLSGYSIEFQQVYKFAKDKNEAELKKLIADGFSLSMSENGMMPATLLAMENDHEAINFLIGKFGVSLDGPAFGYAAIKNDGQVLRLLKLGAPRKAILMGYGMGNHQDNIPLHIWEKISHLEHAALLIKQGNAMGNHIKLDYSEAYYDAIHLIHSYALVGNSKKVNEYLNIVRTFNNREDLRTAYISGITGYYEGNHIQKGDDLLEQSFTEVNVLYLLRNIDRIKLKYDLLCGRIKVSSMPKNLIDDETALNWYLDGNHIAQAEDMFSLQITNVMPLMLHHERNFESYLYSLSFIQNNNLRQKLIDVAPLPGLSNSVEKNVEKINHYMNKLELNYFQAKALLSQNTRRWLTAGFTTLSKLLPVEMAHYILSFLMDLSSKDAADLTKKFRFYIFKRLFVYELESKFFENYFKTTISTNGYLRKFFSKQEQKEIEMQSLTLSERAKTLRATCVLQSIPTALDAISREKKHMETIVAKANTGTTMKLFQPAKILQESYSDTIQRQYKTVGL